MNVKEQNGICQAHGSLSGRTCCSQKVLGNYKEDPQKHQPRKVRTRKTGPGKEATVTPFSLHIKCPNLATCPTGAQVSLKNVKQEDASHALGLADWRHRLPQRQTLQEALA